MFTKTNRVLVAVAAIVGALAIQGVGGAAVLPVKGPASQVAPEQAPVKSSPPKKVWVPVFKVQPKRFVAVDESGPDWLGSDEPMFVFTTVDGDEDPFTVRSPEYGDVDSGSERGFPWMCLLPLCDLLTEPTALSIQLFEMDGGDRDTVRTWVDRAATAFEWGSYLYSGGQEKTEVPDGFVDYLVDLFGDDLMGSTTLRLDPSQLIKRLPSPGTSFTETLRLGGHSGDLPFEVAGGPDYDLDLTITRMPNRIVTR
jgi:hypothetical protein